MARIIEARALTAGMTVTRVGRTPRTPAQVLHVERVGPKVLLTLATDDHGPVFLHPDLRVTVRD